MTTAEAITALVIAGAPSKHIDAGIKYLLDSAERPDWCQYTRHHAWTIYALVRCGGSNLVPTRCIQALKEACHGGGWSHQPGSTPAVFPTFLAWRAFTALAQDSEYQDSQYAEYVAGARQWFKTCGREGQWTLSSGEPSFAATSYAVLALTSRADCPVANRRELQKSTDFLRTGVKSQGRLENEQCVSGDHEYNFHHCALPWSLMALLSAGVTIYDPDIASGFRLLYRSFYSDRTGGWSEEEKRRPSVFGTAHTVAALEAWSQANTIEAYLQFVAEQEEYMAAGDRSSKKVFVVHGHGEVKHEVARWITHLGLEPVILDEQPNQGLDTIFHKLIRVAEDVAYAVVLFTPDDTAKDTSGQEVSRPRQNVVLELGYFVGKLGPGRVCFLKKGEIDVPSDIHGVVYLNLDDRDWKWNLAKEMARASLPVHESRLLE